MRQKRKNNLAKLSLSQVPPEDLIKLTFLGTMAFVCNALEDILRRLPTYRRKKLRTDLMKKTHWCIKDVSASRLAVVDSAPDIDRILKGKGLSDDEIAEIRQQCLRFTKVIADILSRPKEEVAS